MVGAKRTATLPLACSLRSTSGPLLTARWAGSTISVTSKTALKSGSSKQGKARRQSVACIWLVAMTCWLPSPSVYVLRYQPRSLSLRVPVKVISSVTDPGWTGRSMSSRSVASSSVKGTSSPSTRALSMPSSAALRMIRSAASAALASMTTCPTKLAAARSGSSANV